MWKRKKMDKTEELYLASEWKLMWWRFKKNKLAVIGMVILGILYVLGIFCEFFSPYDPNRIFARYTYTLLHRRFTSSTKENS